MKRKIFSTLFALVLVLSLSLVTAVPVAASPDLLPEVEFQKYGDGVAEWSTDKANSGTYSVKLDAGTLGGANAGRIEIVVDSIPIADFTGASFFVWEPATTEHGGEYPSDIAQEYPYGDPNINIYLDFDEDGVWDDCLEGVGSAPVDESAWPDYAETWTEMEEPYGFYDMDDSMGTGQWIAWPIVAGTLTEWRTWLAANQPLCTVVRVKITFGFWADQVTPDVYVDDVEINGVTYDLEPRVINTNTSEGFNTIQDAIDDADTIGGHTITVAAGKYEERIELDESVTLQTSEDAVISGATFTDMADRFIYGVHISADGAKFKGFKLRNWPTTSGFGTVKISASNVTVDDLDILTELEEWWQTAAAPQEIRVWSGAADVTIKNNTITRDWETSHPGIFFQGDVDGLRIEEGNTLTNSKIGGQLGAGQSLTIVNNSITPDAGSIDAIFVTGTGWGPVPPSATVEISNNGPLARDDNSEGKGFIKLFPKIQDAIDEAVSRNTINVAAGTYREIVLIDKSLTLLGANRETTIITDEGAGYSGITNYATIGVGVNDVTISGFTVKATGNAGRTIHVSGCFADWMYPDQGFEATPSNIEVSNNNIFYPSTGGKKTGIIMWNTEDVVIRGNTVVGEESGVNKGIGIYVQFVNPADWENPNRDTEYGSGYTIEDNVISGGSIGMSLGLITDFTISSGNEVSGMSCDLGGGDTNHAAIEVWYAYNGTIERNTVTNNYNGIAVWSDPAGDEDVGVHYNNMVGNTNYGLIASSKVSEVVDARYNWWDDETGPEHSAWNPDGLGDKVSDNVYYEPWLTRVFETVLDEGIGYYGWAMVYLETGWNILSTPYALDDACDTWGDFVTFNGLSGKLYIGEDPEYVNAYYFDSVKQGWGEVGDDYVLIPCDAIYVRMAEPDIAALLANPEQGVEGSVPTKTLYKGWNLVGLSWLPEDPEEYAYRADFALSTVAEVGSLTGYTQVVSPSMNQRGWTFVPSMTPSEWIEGPPPSGYMELAKGYWVFMENGPDDLAGSWFTPMGLP